MNYDPNMTSSGRMAKQTVRLTFGCWDYRKTVETVVGGNCTGFNVIDTAVGRVYEELPEERGAVYIVLERGDDTLYCDADEERGEEWLRDMLIAAEIVAIEPDGRW